MLYGTLENGYVMAGAMKSGVQMALIGVALLASSARAVDANDRESGGVDAQVIAELHQNTQALLDAVAPGDAAVWERLLDARMIQTDENDVVRNKAQILAEFKPLPAGLAGHLTIADFRVVQRGDVAVVSHEDDEYLDYYGQVIRSRFRMTDTWIHLPEGWRQLGSQVLAVLQDPPAQSLPASLLRQYTGTYRLTPEIAGSFIRQGDELVFRREGRPDRHFRAELPDVFFEPGAPRTRRIFSRNGSGQITGFRDRREARDIIWTRQRG
jgi:hypothetical protein